MHATGTAKQDNRTRNARPRPANARAGGDQVQSLVRALSLLNRIAESPSDRATLTDLAQQVGLPASTAHRLLTTSGAGALRALRP